MEKTVLSPWKSFLALKNFNPRILSTFEGSFSIHSLSDLGDLSNLIGSLSRTIKQLFAEGEVNIIQQY